MSSFNDAMAEYRKQLQKGFIKVAYRGLMDYFEALRLHFKKNYPDHFVSGSVYHGYMDMTYFLFFPESLKRRKLKVAIVFVHDTFRFEVWLAGYNKNVQSKYWKLFKETNWKEYNVVPTTKGVDSIIEYTLVENPGFSDLATLTNHIERGTLKFIKDMEDFLSKPKSVTLP